MRSVNRESSVLPPNRHDYLNFLVGCGQILDWRDGLAVQCQTQFEPSGELSICLPLQLVKKAAFDEVLLRNVDNQLTNESTVGERFLQLLRQLKLVDDFASKLPVRLVPGCNYEPARLTDKRTHINNRLTDQLQRRLGTKANAMESIVTIFMKQNQTLRMPQRTRILNAMIGEWATISQSARSRKEVLKLLGYTSLDNAPSLEDMFLDYQKLFLRKSSHLVDEASFLLLPIKELKQEVFISSVT
eukprot:Gregarina_sp_Poly_1__11343@NODE_953_length_5571_cov_345_087754_g677_i0_p2_GENE_NODE_953_length_5571_cov_345_087754_g677_i0NODE_953_length_5571_cov_345_087754_g677_i0_p2_ORF_typecomplete_len244_score29_58_NODE_953_length_5571_cov_345_087754_g677_i035074238